MAKPFIPDGSWPHWMDARTAAGFCGEKTVEAFRRRVGRLYPKPRRVKGRGDVWPKADLVQAMSDETNGVPVDGADLL